MKIENTPENKAKFFALYWGQKRIVYRQGFVNRDNIEIKYIDEFDYLKLTPLSQITTKDAVEVIEVSECHRADYLRSKGYALPWMGLSVEDLVSYGWVKIKH